MKLSNRELVVNKFEKRWSAYDISLEFGIGIKEVYGYIEESEIIKNRHKKAVYAQRELDKKAS